MATYQGDVFQVNGVNRPVPSEMSVTVQKLSKPGAGRTEDGIMHTLFFRKVRSIAFTWNMLPPADVQELAQILKEAIAQDKGLELNTSSWHYGLADTTPSADILKLYKDLGGKIITIGSDAHSSVYLGDHYDDAVEILKDIGFREFATYRDMQPEFHLLARVRMIKADPVRPQGNGRLAVGQRAVLPVSHEREAVRGELGADLMRPPGAQRDAQERQLFRGL